jgi:bacterioferritin (cytochrome b1)
MKITANKSILLNTMSNTTFIATKVTEETQCKGSNRNHIEWVGELDIPIKSNVEILNKLYEEIKHGDEEHQKWLKDKIDLFIERECLD